MGFILTCGVVLFIHVANTQNVLAAGLPHSFVERFLVVIVAEVARTLEREVEILAGTNAREVVSCAS